MTCNGFDLNNLDNEMLDAPIYQHLPDPLTMSDVSDSQDFVSLPCDTFLVACRTESDLKRLDQGQSHFQHGAPMYQSVQMVPGGGGAARHSVGGGEGPAIDSSIALNVNASINADGSARKEGEDGSGTVATGCVCRGGVNK